MEDGIFLTIKDLQRLLGFKHYTNASKEFRTLRDILKKKSKHITIKEYCEYEEIDFEYVWEFLRGDRKKKKTEK